MVLLICVHHTLGFFQVGITALANLTAKYTDSDPPRTFFSLEKVQLIFIIIYDNL